MTNRTENRTFQEVLDLLRDGRHAHFGHTNMAGYYRKAPYPAQDKFTLEDDAYSAIVFFDKDGNRSSPTHLLSDFSPEECEWWIETIKDE